MGRETCGCEACDAERRRDKWRARAELAEQRIAETTRALDAEQAAHAETRKALAVERARVERVREVRRRMATGAAWDALRAQVELGDALADVPAQAPAAEHGVMRPDGRPTVTLDVLCDVLCPPSPAGDVVLSTGAEAPLPATLDDLAALRRDAVRDALLAVAEAAEDSPVPYELVAALRARAGQ